MVTPSSNAQPPAASVSQHERRGRHLEGINAPLLDHLGHVADGALVLDLACGIGDPTLAIARQHPSARVLGIDINAEALETARSRAAEAGLGNVDFATMSMDDLQLESASVDGLTSRLGLLMFGDPAAGARELTRVLRPGAPFSLALWSRAEDSAYMRLGLATLAEVAPDAPVPDLKPLFDRLSSAAAVESWLIEAGCSAVHSEMFEWHVAIADFDAWWEWMTSAGSLTGAFASLDQASTEAAQAHMKNAMASERTEAGSYRLANRCRLVWGSA